MKLVLPFLALLLLSCKTKPECELTTRYAKTIGDGLGKLFSCSNPEQISHDLQETVEDLKLCEHETAQGPIAAILCKPVAKAVSEKALDRALPKSWQCSGGFGADGLELLVYQTCALMPF